MIFADGIIRIFRGLDPVSKHGRDKFIALIATENPTEREKLSALSERLHRNVRNFVNGVTKLSDNTLQNFSKLGGYGEFMRDYFTYLDKRTVSIKSAKVKYGVPYHENWKNSYQQIQLPFLTMLTFPGETEVRNYLRDIDYSIVDFILSVTKGQTEQDVAMEKIPLPRDLKVFFERIRTRDDVGNLELPRTQLVNEFYVGCYVYFLAVREANLPKSPRYITDILVNSINATNFKKCAFGRIHERLKQHGKGWQDICNRIPSEKSATGYMDLPSLWKAINAKQINPYFIFKFYGAYYDIIYPSFPEIGMDKQLCCGAFYMMMLHLSVLDRLVQDNPVIRDGSGKKCIFPLDSAFVKGRISRFIEYVSFAQGQLELRKAGKK